MKSLKKGHTATKNQQQNCLDLFCTHNVVCAAGGNKTNDRNLPTTSRNEYLVFPHADFAMLLVTWILQPVLSDWSVRKIEIKQLEMPTYNMGLPKTV